MGPPRTMRNIGSGSSGGGHSHSLKASASAGAQRKGNNCRKCLVHGVVQATKGHKRNCRFAGCVCNGCRNREIGSQQIRLYRDKSSETPVPPEFEGQGPFCRRCRIHGQWKRWNGHKKMCPYAYCSCDGGCRLVKDRKKNESDLRQAVQGARDPTRLLPPTAAAALASLPLPLGAQATGSSSHTLHSHASNPNAGHKQQLLSNASALLGALPKSSPTGSDNANNNKSSALQQPTPRSHTVLNLLGASASPPSKQDASCAGAGAMHSFDLKPVLPFADGGVRCDWASGPAGNFVFPRTSLPLLQSADGFAFNFAAAQSAPSSAFYYPPFHVSAGSALSPKHELCVCPPGTWSSFSWPPQPTPHAALCPPLINHVDSTLFQSPESFEFKQESVSAASTFGWSPLAPSCTSPVAPTAPLARSLLSGATGGRFGLNGLPPASFASVESWIAPHTHQQQAAQTQQQQFFPPVALQPLTQLTPLAPLSSTPLQMPAPGAGVGVGPGPGLAFPASGLPLSFHRL